MGGRAAPCQLLPRLGGNRGLRKAGSSVRQCPARSLPRKAPSPELKGATTSWERNGLRGDTEKPPDLPKATHGAMNEAQGSWHLSNMCALAEETQRHVENLPSLWKLWHSPVTPSSTILLLKELLTLSLPQEQARLSRLRGSAEDFPVSE